MFQYAPVNNQYVEFLTTSGFGRLGTPVGMTDGRTVEAMIDCEIIDTPTYNTNAVLFFGHKSNGWWFDVDIPANSTGTAWTPRFSTVRGAVTTAAAATTGFQPGRRVILYGKDDGSNVTIYQNGANNASTALSAADGGTPIIDCGNAIDVGRHDTGPIVLRMRLYEAWVRWNKQTVIRWRPKAFMNATVLDMSGLGNALALQGTENTDFRYGVSWSEQVPFPGKENL